MCEEIEAQRIEEIHPMSYTASKTQSAGSKSLWNAAFLVSPQFTEYGQVPDMYL